jgi:hypothetical protein
MLPPGGFCFQYAANPCPAVKRGLRLFLAIKVVYGTVRTRVQYTYVYNCPEYFHSSFRTKVLSYVRTVFYLHVLVRVHLYEDTFVHTSYLPSY